MKLWIDNLDGRGSRDYTAFVEAESAKVVRKLNAPTEFRVCLVGGRVSFAIPVVSARVMFTRENGHNLFTGYVAETPAEQYRGAGERGAEIRYELVALSDVMLLDRKSGALCPAFVGRTAGGGFRQLTQDMLPGQFDLSGVDEGDTIPFISVDPAKKWTTTAAEIALLGRCSYRDDAGQLFLTPLGQHTYSLSESDAYFSPDNLQLRSTGRIVNDLTVLGRLEPAAHVKDYFVGDAYGTTTFYLSQIPFARRNEVPLFNRTILDEEYGTLDPTHWRVVDPRSAVSVSAGQLQIAGGTGVDGQTLVEFVEKIELGGMTVLEHGDFAFSGGSNGVIGGLYDGLISMGACVAGFLITPSGGNCNIRAMVNGVATGNQVATQAGHHYVFTTRLYPTEAYRLQQVYHSSERVSGDARGGAAVASDVRVLLEVHDIDPANPASQVADATVLYDGVIANAPEFCEYALINAADMHCSVAFTYLFLAVDAVVRSAPKDENWKTRRVGARLDGAECRISSTPTLQFYPQHVPAADETIEVTYRSRRRAMARVVNSESIAELKNGADDGVRAAVRNIATPAARTTADCETAALALLDDAGQGWAGEYQAWSEMLPGGAEDIFPGDGLAVGLGSRDVSFLAIVREVEIGVCDLGEEQLLYVLRFVDAGDPGLAIEFEGAGAGLTKALTPVDVSQVGSSFLADLTGAEVVALTSTTVTLDAGWTPTVGSGVEMRYTDSGWGMSNSRNLIGRFTVRTFSLPRYARGQNYFVRRYDNSVPAKYSRNATALHVDYPL